MGDRETEIRDFKEAIKALLFALGKVTNETSLKKMYREQYGESFNQRLLKLGIETTVYNFLRYQCKDICEVYRMDNDNKILRISTDSSSHMDHFQKSRKRTKKGNQAPKLNVPKMGILQNTTFRRLNPQGFNKNKVVSNNRNLINAYRYPNPVNLENKENAANELENEYAPNSKITLEDFVPLKGTSEADEATAMQPLSSIADAVKHANMPQHPCSYLHEVDVAVNVTNSGDFPTLCEKKNSIEGHNDSEEYERNGDIKSSSEQSALMKNWNKVAAALQTPTRTAIRTRDPPTFAPKLLAFNQHTTPIAKPAFPHPPPALVKVNAPLFSEPPPTTNQNAVVFLNPPPGFQQQPQQQPATSSPKPTASYPFNYASSISSATSMESLRKIDQVPAQQKKLPFNNISIDDPIFLVGYQGIILNADRKLTKPQPKIFGTKISFPVHAAIIHHPGHITLHFDDNSLRRLFNDMQRYYEELSSTALLINDTNFKVGLLVAVKIFGFWHRASISGNLYENGSVLVTFEDFGYSLEVHRERIRHLISAFTEVPRLCIHASLAGIEAPNGYGWSYESQEKLKELTIAKTLFASLRSYDVKEDIYTIDLIANFTTTLTISDELIESKVAKSAPVDQTLPYGYIFPYNDY